MYAKGILSRFGILSDGKCLFCNDKSIRHLFFECGFGKDIWTRVLTWIGVQHVPMQWEDELRWTLQAAKGKTEEAWKQMLKCAFMDTAYFIWRTRNNKVHEGVQAKHYSRDVICRIMAVSCVKMPELNEFIMMD